MATLFKGNEAEGKLLFRHGGRFIQERTLSFFFNGWSP
jgi:hypothetical protein